MQEHFKREKTNNWLKIISISFLFKCLHFIDLISKLLQKQAIFKNKELIKLQ